jgi:hypothetical protein
MTTRREWLSGCLLAGLPCRARLEARLSWTDIPASAVSFAHGLGLSETEWPHLLEQRTQELESRLRRGSAEHVAYYVMQSLSFTDAPPSDPVKLAALRPALMPAHVGQRFRDFEAGPPRDDRHRIVRDLLRSSGLTFEECFREAMTFLASTSHRENRDGLYQARGLSADSTPANMEVLKQASVYLTEPLLLVGPGLDLTRREGFSDDFPLKSHQAEWLRAQIPALECLDARPEVVAFLQTGGICAVRGDIATDIVSRGRYGTAIATNLLLYLDEAGLFLAMASIAAGLRPGGHFIHNDTRFAGKVFGEAVGIPVVRFEAIELGRRGEVAQMDRLVVHRKVSA